MYIDICRYFDLILWSIRSGFFGQSGPGHAAVLRGGAGDARNLAEPGLKKQMTDMFGLFKLRFYTNICLTLHVMFWWTQRLMIHTAYTACVQQPTTFHIIPQPSLLRHLTTAQTSRCRLEVHNPGGFNSYVDWLIHFSALTFSSFSDRSCTIHFSDPVYGLVQYQAIEPFNSEDKETMWIWDNQNPWRMTTDRQTLSTKHPSLCTF